MPPQLQVLMARRLPKRGRGRGRPMGRPPAPAPAEEVVVEEEEEESEEEQEEAEGEAGVKKQARCGTFGCILPDRHTGLHQLGAPLPPTARALGWPVCS